MEKEFIPYKQALELKELGFREDTSAYYFTWDDERSLRFAQDSGNEIDWNEPPMGMDTQTDYVSAPLYQQAFRWFREKYDGIALIQTHSYGYNGEEFKRSYHPYVEVGGKGYNLGFLPTYEEAELACLIKLIEITKNK